ncbi:MAG: phosphoribosyltransferase family protein [Candidatus Moranbacteria bacterium]|nr:phosphoribosyltransferase family protein [Candidatus Moranbacteria bacterium]
MVDIDEKALIQRAGVLVSNDHLIYKSGQHGDKYLNKEHLVRLNAIEMVALLEKMAFNFCRVEQIIPYGGEIGVLGPAMGAIPYALTVASKLQRYFDGAARFFPARTELKTLPDGKKTHHFPEKLLAEYRGKKIIIVEDIVNAGTTIREVASLCRKKLGNDSVLAAMCLMERGGQTASSLGILSFHPLMVTPMPQHKPENCPLCKAGIPINIILGKGERWVNLFGQPPYPPGTDFSAFWK